MPVHILTALVHSGKTTRLMEWAARKEDVYGVLSPVSGGKRFFMNAATKERFEMEAAAGEERVIAVGRFFFKEDAFTKAIGIISDAMLQPKGWIVVDEIGPLELRGAGFYSIVKQLLEADGLPLNVLLVVREPLADQVVQAFELSRADLTISSSLPG